jgi:NodT family efflux transporter outer membrane factor (OMF) lipoprotein
MSGRNLNIIVFVGFLILTLLSCVSLPTEPPQLDFEVPEERKEEEGFEPGDLSEWWKRFGDSGLNEVVETAFKENYDLKAAVARLEAAAARARIAGADLFPQVSGSLLASRQKRVFVGFPFGSAGGAVPSSTTSLFGLSLDVSWEADLWGRLSASKAAALADFQASEADWIGFQLSLAGQTAKAWFAAVEAQQQLELTEATLENYKTTNNQVLLRYRRGLRPSLDVRLSESNVATAESNLALRKDQLQIFKRQLEALLGRYPANRIELSEQLPLIRQPIPEGLPADIIRQRPDLIAVERRLAASQMRVKEAKGLLYPRISLTASGGTSSAELKDLLDGDYSVWNLASNILQPLFQGGRIRAGIDQAKAEEAETLARYAQSVLNAYAEIEASLDSEKFLSERERALEIAAEQAVAARKLSDERYARGLTDFIEVLESQRRAFISQSQLLNVRRLRLENRIGLFMALGGDFITPSDLEKITGKE